MERRALARARARRTSSIYELHVGTFTPEGTFDAVSRAPARAARARRHGDRADAGRVVSRDAATGATTACTSTRRSTRYGGPDGLTPPRERRARARARAWCSTSSTTTSGRRGTTSTRSARTSPTCTARRGGAPSTTTAAAATRCAAGRTTTRCTGSTEFHVDALRLDAVHGIFDFGALAFLEELSDDVHELGRQLGRKVQLIAESDLNDPRLVRPPEQGGYRRSTRSGRTTSITRCTRAHRRAARLLRRTSRRRDDRRRLPRAVRLRAALLRRIATAPTAARPPACRGSGSSSARRTTTRWATAPTGRAARDARVAGARGSRRRSCCCRRTCRCSSWARSTARRRPSSTSSSTAIPSSSRRCARGGGASSRRSSWHGERSPIRRPRRRSSAAELDWERRDRASRARRCCALYRDLLALRREEPALQPGRARCTSCRASTTGAQCCAPCHLPGDIFDAVRARRTVLLRVQPQRRAAATSPCPTRRRGRWRLRLSTDAAGYGGAGTRRTIVPAAERRTGRRRTEAAARRATPRGERARTVRLAPWSAAVYVRDFEDESSR